LTSSKPYILLTSQQWYFLE